MPTRTINLGPGAQLYHAPVNTGLNLIVNMGEGGDTFISGGGGLRVRPEGGTYRVFANTGLDPFARVQIDHYYTESLPNPQDGHRWVGGHVLRGDVYAEFHHVAAGPGDHIRVSLFDQRHYEMTGDLRMMSGHVPGLIEIHGPGVKGHATRIKSFDAHGDGQQFAWAAEGMHQTRIEAVEGVVTREADGDGFEFFVTRFQARTVTDDMLTNGQRADFQHMDMLRGEARAEFALHIDANTYAAKVDAVEAMFEEWGDRPDPAVLWGL